MFGVIRREALARTGLMRNYHGAEKVVLAELAMFGRFVQSPKKLYLRRHHDGMSWALSRQERKTYCTSDDDRYSPRLRQLAAFGAAPFGKGLTAAEITAFLGLVLLLIPKVALATLLGEERRQELRRVHWCHRSESKDAVGPERAADIPQPSRTQNA
jgi:hypothetical protein